MDNFDALSDEIKDAVDNLIATAKFSRDSEKDYHRMSHYMGASRIVLRSAGMSTLESTDKVNELMGIKLS